MPLKIKTTGVEQYAPGGGGALKMLLVGGPGVGKTRMSSYWPRPIYADCEGGLASVADRTVPFVTINSSQDMLDFLAYMKIECRRPYIERQYQTVVIDTLDAFHRKVKDEWLAANPGVSSFRGFEAWGYLETKMQMLLTRLLNLDCNVIVSAHPKDKVIREGSGDNAVERQEMTLQLQGEVKDNIYNDFDLVGYMGKYFAAEDGQRVEKRGITFKATPDKPFLKDRLNITPPWMEITFSDEDYANLFAKFTARLDDLVISEEVGEIPSEVPEEPSWRPTTAGNGPMPPADPRDIPLAQMDKATLMTKARGMGLAVKGNTLKGELILLIEDALHAQADAKSATPAETPETNAAPEQPAVQAAPAAPAATEPAVTQSNPVPSSAAQALQDAKDAAAAAGHAPQPQPEQPAPVDVSNVLEEIPDETQAATDLVQNELGGRVISDDADAEGTPMALDETIARTAVENAEALAPAPASKKADAACQRCGADTTVGNQDYVKIGKIKFRLLLCNEHYAEARDVPNSPWIKELQRQSA